MRITYLHQYFNTPTMSGSTRSYEMARRLVKMGHEVNLITAWRGGGSENGWFMTEEAGIRVHWISIPYSNRMGYGRRIQAFLKFAIHAARRAAGIPSDLIFASSTPLTIALPAVWASWRKRIPMVLEVRDLWPEVPIAMGALNNPIIRQTAKLLEKFAYAKSSAIVALSPDMKNGIVRAGYPDKQVFVIPNGSDLDLLKTNSNAAQSFRVDHQIPLDRILMVYAGTLGKVNGVGYLVELAKEMADDSRFYILIIGDGAERDSIQAAAISSGRLNDNLKIIGQVPKSEIGRVLSSADITISTVIPIKELEANSANKVFDGMAAGNCIAINHGGWLNKLLKETRAGMVLSQNPQLAAAELRRWLDDPDKLKEAKVNARRLAEEVFSRDKLAKNLDEIIKEK